MAVSAAHPVSVRMDVGTTVAMAISTDTGRVGMPERMASSEVAQASRKEREEGNAVSKDVAAAPAKEVVAAAAALPCGMGSATAAAMKLRTTRDLMTIFASL